MTTYISLAVSATMFPESGMIEMWPIAPERVRTWVESGDEHDGEIVSALNPSHRCTIDVIHRRYGIDLPIPERAPKVVLEPGDRLIIVQANLPRLAEGERHGDETVENASISFRVWAIQPVSWKE